ncbi:DNA ligase [Desulfomarina profundi]|uniref:DNA ligase n=1 Tax=Desulfomarina profundi TaxID=2772557 RepID=A0A8D5FQY9_9BACT|nr:BRCT domain-containing protein [Desulfomarina profundi]BCL62115.1 DNA ligase [Desulfomarina profundi]
MNQLNREQLQLLEKAGFAFQKITQEQVLAIVRGEVPVEDLDDTSLVECLTVANLLYRGGFPLVSDYVYDFIFLAELKKRRPDHPFLQKVEPEPVALAKTVPLPVRMLSTEKAYEFKSVQRWAERIRKAADGIGVDFPSLLFRATPKLDGFAAYDDGERLYTRGDGRRGTDISRVFARGLQVAEGGKRGLGPGEIVVRRSYFQKHLARVYDNSRNFQASLIREKDLDPLAAEAIRQKGAVFFPFVLLPDWRGVWRELSENFETVIGDLWNRLDFDIDGIVLEILDERLKESMGATRHHHRWQIAYKKNTETARVKVIAVTPQTSRSGRVNPVAEVEPTRLSGALIRRVTVHHYGMVREKGVGPGSVIELSRSGEVIPKIEKVLVTAEPQLPESCPSCNSNLIWDSDYLRCIDNMNCPAQITHSIGHFFKTLGNIDGFGPASINRLYQHGVRSVYSIYTLSAGEYEKMGFGPRQSENMVAQLQRSRTEKIEDWRFLAAFGVYRMGPGNCEKLLSMFPLEKIFSLTREDVASIKGFKEKTADAVVEGMQAIFPLFTQLYELGFNLAKTPVAGYEENKFLPLQGKIIVFTGAMQQGSRQEMEKQAKLLGAKPGKSVTGKTDILVTGQRVGPAKLNKAKDAGIKIMNEQEYLEMIRNME